MASSHPTPQEVSEQTKAQGGQAQGSTAAQMQSQLDKDRNAEQVLKDVKAKMDAGLPLSEEEADLAESREHRARGIRPPSGSIASQAKSYVSRQDNLDDAAEPVIDKLNDDPTKVTDRDAALLQSREDRAGVQQGLGADAQSLAAANDALAKVDPATQSKQDRVKNFEDMAEQVASKVGNDPSNLSKEEADMLHSREERAFGKAAKASEGGIAANAQKVAAENEK